VYVEREIPPNDAILILPDEDLFYYTIGREPRFPMLEFDITTHAYAFEEAELSRQSAPRIPGGMRVSSVC
jgi:hypothetical protein